MTSRLRLLLLLSFCYLSSALAGKASGFNLDHELVDPPAASQRCFLGICIPSKGSKRGVVDSHSLNGATDPFLGYVGPSPNDLDGGPSLRGADRRHVQAASQYDTREDTLSCGFSYECVAVQNAKRVACVRGGCRVMGCIDGYAPDAENLACVPSDQGRKFATQLGRDGGKSLRKRGISSNPSQSRLCRSSHEVACPLSINKMLRQQGKHRDGEEEDEVDLLVGGGFECIDTMNSLTSCGGCQRTGAGRDCTTIQHADGVSCRAGRCMVLSCRRGWHPSASGDHCLRGRDGSDHERYRDRSSTHGAKPRRPPTSRKPSN